jgi:hypothetical protein
MEKWLENAMAKTTDRSVKGKGKGKGSETNAKRRRTVASDTGVEAAIAGLTAAVTAFGDLSLGTAGNQRQLSGGLMHTLLVPSDALLEKPMQTTMSVTDRLISHQCVWASLVAAVSEAVLTETNQSAISTLKAHKLQPQEGWEKEVTFCRVQYTHDSTKIKVQFWTASSLDGIGNALATVLVGMNATLMLGPPPRSAKERAALNALLQLRK